MIKWFLDNTLDIALAYVRAVAIVCPTLALVCFVASIWTAPERWELITSGGLLLFVATGAGYLGFYLYGNEEWRAARGDADR